MDIEQLKAKNLKELNSLEFKSTQLKTEIQTLMKDLGLEKVPTKEQIQGEIDTLNTQIEEETTKLNTLIKEYEVLSQDSL